MTHRFISSCFHHKCHVCSKLGRICFVLGPCRLLRSLAFPSLHVSASVHTHLCVYTHTPSALTVDPVCRMQAGARSAAAGLGSLLKGPSTDDYHISGLQRGFVCSGDERIRCEWPVDGMHGHCPRAESAWVGTRSHKRGPMLAQSLLEHVLW